MRAARKGGRMSAAVRRWARWRLAIAAVAAVALLAAIPAAIDAAGEHDPTGASQTVVDAPQPLPDSPDAAVLAESAKPPGDVGLDGWAIAGIAISVVIAALLLAGAAGYLLPKPPRR